MARQTLEYTDKAREGTDKINEMTLELYSIATNSITAAESLTGGDVGTLHLCSGTTDDYTVDLPTAVGNEGIIIFKGLSTLTKVVTIAGISGQTIDGEANRKISTCGMLSLLSDGANWVVIGEVGSWIPYTPTLTGFSANQTIDRAAYFRVGKMVIVQIHASANGTSDATTKTITLPFNAAAGAVQLGLTTAIANSGTTATAPGIVATRVSSNIADVYRNLAAQTWTASGGARYSFTLNYVIE